MKKKWICELIILILIAAVCIGCTKTDNKNNMEVEKKQETVGEVVNKSLRIALVTGSAGIDDGGFNESNYKGIQLFLEKNPESSMAAYTLEKEEPEQAIEKLAEIVNDFDVIVCGGYLFEGLGEFAKKHEQKDFILVDAYPTAKDDVKTIYENVYGMKFAEQESGFCAGIAAALESQTGKVAVVNGMACPSNRNYQRGFYAGVDYADKHFATKTEIVELPEYAGKDEQKQDVKGNYVGSFNDTEKGNVIGKALMDKGVDIIFTAAGRSGEGVFSAVKEAVDKPDVKVIGCDADQYDDGAAPKGNIVLTSVFKTIDTNVDKQLNNIKTGKFKGDNVLLKANTYATGYVKDHGRHQLSEDTIKRIDDAFELVKNGTIEMPSK